METIFFLIIGGLAGMYVREKWPRVRAWLDKRAG